MQALKIQIHGEVYQTGMLYFLKQEAYENNIMGCVFYYSDHSVIVFAEGEKQDLDNFIKACGNGNNDSLVENFSVWRKPVQGYVSFDVLDKMESIKIKSEII